MGLFDWLTGTKKPKDDIPVLPSEQVHANLLALNRSDAPFVIREDGDNADLISEWRIVDSEWYEIFAKAGLSKVSQVLMRFDTEKDEVRSTDRWWTVKWTAGIPELSIDKESSKGQGNYKEFGKAYAFTAEGKFGEVYNYRFDTDELKNPLQDVVTSSGWTWRAVTFGDL